MEKLQDGKFLGEEKISKLLLRFSIPCILSLLIGSLYNIVDQIFIGNSELGYLGNAATTIVFPITIISVAFAWCLGDGTASYLSICQGQKDTKRAHQCVANSIAATFLISLLFILFCWTFQDPLLYAFGASEATIALARDYFLIILAAIPAYMLMNMMNGIIRADGSPTYSMVSLLIGALINIVLDPLFIFVFHWGIKGAAYATIIGQIVSFIISALYFFRAKTFKLSLHSFVPNWNLLGTVIKMGISTFISEMAIVIVSLICNIMLVKYGSLSKYGVDIPIAIIGIAMKVFTIIISIVVGIILGGQPILGYNYGAQKYGRVKETYRLSLIATLTIGIVATLVFELCPDAIIILFGAQTELYNEFARMTFRVYLSLITFTCIIKMTSIFFQSVGEPTKAATLSLTRDIVCFLPLVILLPLGMGISGILWAAPVADLLAMILTILLVSSFFKKLDRNHPTSTNVAGDQPVINPSMMHLKGDAGIC